MKSQRKPYSSDFKSVEKASALALVAECQVRSSWAQLLLQDKSSLWQQSIYQREPVCANLV